MHKETYIINVQKIYIAALVSLLTAAAVFAAYTSASAQSAETVIAEPSVSQQADGTAEQAVEQADETAEPTDEERNARDRLIEKRDGLLQRKLDAAEALQDKRNNVRNTVQNVKETTQERAQETRSNNAGNGGTSTKERIEKKREEIREKLNDLAKKRIEAYVKRIVRRLNAALDRLERIGERIESRIEKLEERGLDMSEALALLDTMRAETAKARGDIESVETAIGGILDSENPRESFSEIRDLIESAKNSVKGAHRALVDAIISVKAGIGAGSSGEVE